ncbi:hypothetical protein Poly51_02180 [Rubripirellula tenax]|uniref:Uncharacterized protein n=1 Tax=Rubripirellula tenax TaxID=2528015 RepID=A0A5C6FGH5_9BACT|nr:hypothetical protein Poly51_02180 [Rubripirellula tenax]
MTTVDCRAFSCVNNSQNHALDRSRACKVFSSGCVDRPGSVNAAVTRAER